MRPATPELPPPDPLALEPGERRSLGGAGAAHADLFAEQRLGWCRGPDGDQRLLLAGETLRRLAADGSEQLDARSLAPAALKAPAPWSDVELAEAERELERALGRLAAAGIEPVRVELTWRRLRLALPHGARERTERRILAEGRDGEGTLFWAAARADRLRIAPRPEPPTPPPAPLLTGPVWLGPQAAGVLLHEAIGHGTEVGAAGQEPALAVGVAVGPEALDVVDDPTVEALAGSLRFDDDGSAAAPVNLVHRGRVTGTIGSLRSQLLRRGPAAARARRASFRDPPIPRLTNLFVAAGREDDEALRGAAAVVVERATAGEASIDGRQARLHARSLWAAGSWHGPATVVVAVAALRSMRLGRRCRVEPLALCGRAGQEVAVAVSAPGVLVEATVSPS